MNPVPETIPQIEIRRPAPEIEEAIAGFFEHLHESGVATHFHPHPFTRQTARERALYVGKDVYCVAIAAGEVLGYGMLRGWDDGFAIPSLGIATHSRARGAGIGRMIMEYLHVEARRRGAPKIRLRVHPDNQAAQRLYRSLGYEFQTELDRGQLLGFLTLSRRGG